MRKIVAGSAMDCIESRYPVSNTGNHKHRSSRIPFRRFQSTFFLPDRTWIIWQLMDVVVFNNNEGIGIGFEATSEEHEIKSFLSKQTVIIVFLI